MIDRRAFLLLSVGASLTAALCPFRSAHAQGAAQAAERAATFIKTTGDRLVAVVNGNAPPKQKRQELARIIEGSVDIEGVGRFCLGRFWRQATPEQQKTYLSLFHEVLINSITAKLGEYQGVRFTMGKARTQDDDQIVSTVVERPNNAPAAVDWVISQVQTNPRIIDVIAEGTSMRITQRSDYAAYLQRNNNNIDALLTAMRQQIAQHG